MTTKTKKRPPATSPAMKAAPEGVLERVPLELLDVAPENVRAKLKPENVEELAANVLAVGLLQNLVGYREGGRVKVTCGRRRLAALKMAGLADAPVLVRDKAGAIEASLAENTQRVRMHPATEAKAYSDVIAKGTPAESVANAYGVTVRYIEQRARLASLHPPIFKALADDALGLEAAEAYANAPLERQPALFKRFGKNANAWSIRRELNESSLQGTDRLALFVGEAAYLAAGGRTQRQLFADRHEKGEPPALWLDKKIAERLALERLGAEAKKLKAEGWREVMNVIADFDTWKFETVRTPKKADRKKFNAFVGVDAKGQLIVKRGVVTRGSAKKSAPKKKAGPAPAMTNKAHESSTRIASGIVGAMLAATPDVALVAVVAHLARRRFAPDNSSPLRLSMSPVYFPAKRDVNPRERNPDLVFYPDDAPLLRNVFEADAVRVLEKLGPIDETLEDRLAARPTVEVLDLFAFLVAPAVAVIEMGQRDDQEDRTERERLARLGRLCDLTVNEYWTPNSAWFMGQSSAELDRLWTQLMRNAVKPKSKKAKAAALAANAAETGWVPPLVEELTGTAGYFERAGKAVKS